MSVRLRDRLLGGSTGGHQPDRRRYLPEGVTPGLSPWSPTGEIVRYVLEGPGYTLNQLKAVQDWVLNRTLKQVPGVIDVTGFGGSVKQYHVLLDSRLLKQYGVTMQQVEDAIKNSNANVGGDILTLGTQSHNVRATGLLGGGIDPIDPAKVDHAAVIEAEKLDDIRKVVVDTAEDGTPIYVRQVARAIVGYQPRLGIVGRGVRNDVVEGIVLMGKYEKSLPTSEAVEVTPVFWSVGSPFLGLMEISCFLPPAGGPTRSAPSNAAVAIFRIESCVRIEATCSASAARMRAAVVTIAGVVSKPAAPPYAETPMSSKMRESLRKSASESKPNPNALRLIFGLAITCEPSAERSSLTCARSSLPICSTI